MNFNLTKTPEYKLFREVSKEFIDLYGIVCKYFVTEKILPNKVLGEHQGIKYNSKKGIQITILPSNTENWDGQTMFSSFGMQNLESLVGYIHVEDMKRIHPKISAKEGYNFDDIIGDIVIFDSGKIMEVSMISAYSEGSLNNLYAYNDQKNIYKITLKTHIEHYDLSKDLKTSEILEDQEDYEKIENLEKIFELDQETKEIQKETKISKKQTHSDRDSNYNSLFGNLG